jgi:hypothetical protein
MLHMVLIVCTHGATSQTNKISWIYNPVLT